MLKKIKNLFEKEGFLLDDEQAKKFNVYLRELLKWNKVHNLTAIREPEKVIKRHFIDSVSLVRCFESIEFEWKGKHFVDVGSGAGFPGIPLKIYLKDIKLTLVEAVAKKCAFLEYIKVKINEDYEVVCERAEKLDRKFDVSVARALGKFEDVKELMESLTDEYVFILKGSQLKEEWLDDYNFCKVSLSFVSESYILWKKL